MIFFRQLHMQKKIGKIFNFINYFFLIFFISNVIIITAHSNENIVVKGNLNINTSTILSYLPKNFNIENKNSINQFQKKLFEQGYFKSININLVNEKLIVQVIENPLVNFFFIEGIKQKSIVDKIRDLINLKENNILQPYLIKSDLEKIGTFLYSLGYLSPELEYQIKEIDGNKVNVFYNISLNNKFHIKRIFFIGDKKFKSSTLADVVYSGEHGWWKFFSNNSIPSENVLNYDVTRLKNFYLDNGYYDIQITSSSIQILDNEKVNLVYSINAGEKYFINSLNTVDETSSIDQNALSYFDDLYENYVNKTYSKKSLSNITKKFEKYLLSSKYNINVKYILDKIESNKFNVKFIFFENPSIVILDKINIYGNNITDDFVIRNFISQSEGDILNQKIIQDSIDKLKDSGLFKNASYDLKINDDNRADLNVEVIEQPTGEIGAGAGAGTNGVNLSASINEKNFMGRGINLNSTLSLGTQKVLGAISYKNKDFMNSGKELSTSFFVQSTDFENASYTNKIIGSNIFLNYEIYENIFLNPGFAIDYDSVEANNNASTYIKSKEGNYYTSKFIYNISKNTRNRLINPTSGYSIGAGQEWSLISDIQYLNNKIFGSYYNEYIDGFVGSIKYRAETINSFDKDIKFSDKLFVSSNNLRGFANRGIGPKIDGDFVGGNYSYYTSLSSTLPNGLPEKWNASTAIFLDLANVWGVDDSNVVENNKLRSSTGIGFSWFSPLGPVSMTYAIPLSKASTDDIEEFNFKIGTIF